MMSPCRVFGRHVGLSNASIQQQYGELTNSIKRFLPYTGRLGLLNVINLRQVWQHIVSCRGYLRAVRCWTDFRGLAPFGQCFRCDAYTGAAYNSWLREKLAFRSQWSTDVWKQPLQCQCWSSGLCTYPFDVLRIASPHVRLRSQVLQRHLKTYTSIIHYIIWSLVIHIHVSQWA